MNIYDVSDPGAPVLATSVLCPGNQNDISVYGDLLILSVEAISGRVDCTSANRQDDLPAKVDANLTKFIDRAERFSTGPQSAAAAANLRAVERQLGDSDVEAGLGAALLELANEIG